MPTAVSLSTVSIRTQGFAGGANIRDAINLVAPTEARPLENIVFDERGGGQKRRGCAFRGTFGAAGARVLSMYTFYRGPLFLPQVILHTTDGNLFYTDAPDVSPTAWHPIASGLSPSSPMSYETYLGKVYMGNGVDPYCSWSGTAFATFPSAPRGRFHRLWKERIWISGVIGENDRIYASDKGTASTFTVASWVDIAAGDGDQIRALATDGQFLVVGKREMTHTVYDPVEFFNRVVDSEKGFEGHFAATQFEGSLYFISRRGVCQYMGDSPSVVISERIDPVFSPEMIALDQLEKATCYTYLNRVGFAVPEVGSTHNTLVLEYYPRLAGVTTTGARSVGPFTFHRMPVQAFAKWRWGGDESLFGAHNQANKLLHVFAPVGTDDGVPFQAILQTAWFDFGDPKHTKYLRELRILCSGRFELLIYRDFSQWIHRTIPVDIRGGIDVWDIADDLWGEGLWGGEELVQDVRKTNIDGYGRYFSFRFQDSFEQDTNSQIFWIGSQGRDTIVGEWAIYGLVAEGTMLGKRS